MDTLRTYKRVVLALLLGASAACTTVADPTQIRSPGPVVATATERGASCSAIGATDCGGNCSISCPVGRQARCVGGECNPKWPYGCQCVRYTSCTCD